MNGQKTIRPYQLLAAINAERGVAYRLRLRLSFWKWTAITFAVVSFVEGLVIVGGV